jgi:hypothetical protein
MTGSQGFPSSRRLRLSTDMRRPAGETPPIFRKPVSGAGACAVASIKIGGGICWAERTDDKPKKAARVLTPSHVFILIIHPNSIDEANGRN